MITTESTMRIVWFRPSMIERRASGSCTLREDLPLRRARRRGGLDRLGRHLADPERGQADPGRDRVDHRRDRRRERDRR